MAKRFVVTQPSFIGDTYLLPGQTVDTDDGFQPPAHFTASAVSLPADEVYVPAHSVSPPAAIPIPPAVAVPLVVPPPTLSIHKAKPKR